MDFIISGAGYHLTREQVEERMSGIEPELGRTGRRHFVEIADREYPITQVLPIMLGISKADVTTYRARDILKRLGFLVTERP